jgi:hypothetical protein
MKLWKNIMDATDYYAKQSKWTDFALLKICLAAVGVIIGLSIPNQKRKSVFWGSAIVYTATGIPLIMKFLPILKKQIEAPNTSQSDFDFEQSEMDPL